MEAIEKDKLVKFGYNEKEIEAMSPLQAYETLNFMHEEKRDREFLASEETNPLIIEGRSRLQEELDNTLADGKVKLPEGGIKMPVPIFANDYQQDYTKEYEQAFGEEEKKETLSKEKPLEQNIEVKLEREILAQVITNAVVDTGTAKKQDRPFTINELVYHCKEMGKALMEKKKIMGYAYDSKKETLNKMMKERSRGSRDIEM